MRHPDLTACAVGLAVCLAVQLAARPAASQEFTFHAEPAAAFWVDEPQMSRFTPGFYMAVRPGIALGRVVALQLSYALLITTEGEDYTDDGAAHFLLAGVRVRPLATLQPESEQLGGLFADLNLGYVRTGDLDRFGFDVGLGYGFQVAPWFSLGPVVRYGQIVQPNDTLNQDSSDGQFITAGLDLAFGAAHEEKEAVASPAEDTAPPTVVCTSPGNGVTGVAIDRNVTATFSEVMDRPTITTSTFTVKQGTWPVAGTVSFAGGNVASFDPTSELKNDTVYTATMASGVKDKAGNVMADTYVWSFTTIPAPRAAAEPVVLVMLDDNYFEFDQSAITPQGVEILDENIKILKSNPKVRIRIAGYTSAQGTEDYNQKLSERRAESVRNYLVKGGIAADRLVTIGFGRTRPAEFEALPDNIYSKEAKANMRVLFEVIVK